MTHNAFGMVCRHNHRAIAGRGFAIVLLLASVGNAEATLCQKRSGMLAIREACKKNETAVDLSSIGLKGEPGVPGSARAYAFVTAEGTLDVARTRGFTAVRSPAAGQFCLTADPGFIADTNRVTPVATIALDASPGTITYVFYHPSVCQPGEVGFATADTDTGVFRFTGQSFSVVVP